MMSKYHSVRTWSNLAGRWFASKGECRRGEELHLLEMAGEISDLKYQVRFVLCKKPNISITVDFVYTENGKVVYEDFKGKMLADFRVKMAWLAEQQNIIIRLVR